MLAAWNKGKERGQNTLWWSLRYFTWHTGANVFVKVHSYMYLSMCLHVFVKVFYVFVKVVVKERNEGKEWGQNTLWWSLRCFTVTYWTYHHCLAIYNIISLLPSLSSLLNETIPYRSVEAVWSMSLNTHLVCVIIWLFSCSQKKIMRS